MNYIEQLKNIQKRIWIKTLIVFLIFCLPFLIIVISFKYDSIFEFIECIIIFSAIISINVYWISKSISEGDIESYKKTYAKNITLEILKNNFEDVKYNPSDDLPPKDFANVIDNAKIPTINSYSSNDYISAKYKNIQIEYSDIRMGYIPRNRDTNHHENFKGKWLVLNFDKNFKSNIQIVPKIFNGKKTGQMLKGKEYKKIKTTDFELDKKITIYANNEEKVLKILTTNIIDNIKRLYSKTNGKLLIFFLHNQIHIFIGDKKNFFEPNVYKKFDLEKEKKKIQNQIKNIIELIDSWI